MCGGPERSQVGGERPAQVVERQPVTPHAVSNAACASATVERCCGFAPDVDRLGGNRLPRCSGSFRMAEVAGRMGTLLIPFFVLVGEGDRQPILVDPVPL